MSLVWHIVRKDLRRMALPVALWIALSAVTAFFSRTAAASAQPSDTADSVVRIGPVVTFANYANVAGMVLLAAGVILVGQLVLEDRVTGSGSFWQTRPISGGRLLAAKAIAGGLLFVAAPTMATLPVLLASGFFPADMPSFILNAIAAQLVLVGTAMMLAALAGDLGEHAFAALVTVVIGLVAFSDFPTARGGARFAPDLIRWRDTVAGLLLLATFAFVLVQQFRTRRCWRWWTILALTFGAVFALRMVWTRGARVVPLQLPREEARP